jgi:hypothetical protein
MSSYRVYLRGENFWLEIEGRGRVCVGFHTSRYVEAASPEEAEHAAIAGLRGESKLKPLNEHDDPPLVFMEELEEVDAAAAPAAPPALTFFDDDAARTIPT